MNDVIVKGPLKTRYATAQRCDRLFSLSPAARAFRGSLFIVLFFLLAGCEELPELDVARLQPLDSGLLSSDTDRCDWPIQGAGFAVERPAMFTFFDRIDSSGYQQAEQLLAGPAAQQLLIPPDLDDDIAFWLRELAEPQAARSTVLPLPVVGLFSTERLEQLETCAPVLREHTLIGTRTGEGLYSQLVRELAEAWGELLPVDLQPTNTSQDGALQPDSPSAELAVIEAWATQQSELALAVSARKNSAWKRSSSTGGGILHSRTSTDLQQAELALDRFLELDVPPAFAFEQKIELLREARGSRLEAEPLLIRYTSLYPLEVRAHSLLCGWLLPSNGGAIGEGSTYVENLADAYPQSVADLVFSRIVLDFATSISSLFPGAGVSSTAVASSHVTQSGFSKDRLEKGARLLMDRDMLDSAQAEFLLDHYRSPQEADFRQRVAEYRAKPIGD